MDKVFGKYKKDLNRDFVEDSFAGYASFSECVSQNSDKDDPEAYCGEIKKRAEDKKGTPKRDGSGGGTRENYNRGGCNDLTEDLKIPLEDKIKWFFKEFNSMNLDDFFDILSHTDTRKTGQSELKRNILEFFERTGYDVDEGDFDFILERIKLQKEYLKEHGKGKGWYGESERHSEAAKKGRKLDFKYIGKLTLDDRSKSDKIEGGRKGRWVTVRGKHVFLAKGEKVEFHKDGKVSIVSKEKFEKKKEKRTKKVIERKGYERERAERKVKEKRVKRKKEAEYESPSKEEPTKKEKKEQKERLEKKEPERKWYEPKGESKESAKERVEREAKEIEKKVEAKPKKKKDQDWIKYRRKRKIQAIKTQEKALIKASKGMGISDVINGLVRLLNEAYNGKEVNLAAFGSAYDRVQKNKKLKKEKKERIQNRIKTLKKEVSELRSIKLEKLSKELKALKESDFIKLDFTITPLTEDAAKAITPTNPKGAGRPRKRGLKKGTTGAKESGAKRTTTGKSLTKTYGTEVWKVEPPESVTIERPSGITQVHTVPVDIDLSRYQFVNTETGAVVSGIMEEDPNRNTKQLTPVSSSNVRSSGQFGKELLVQFHPQGKKLNTYRFEFTTPEGAAQANEAIQTTGSPGRWIWKYLRGHIKGTDPNGPGKKAPSLSPPGQGKQTIGGTSASLVKYSVSARSPVGRVSGFEGAVKQLKRLTSNPIGKVGRPRTRGQNKRGISIGSRVEQHLATKKAFRDKGFKRLDFRYVGNVLTEDYPVEEYTRTSKGGKKHLVVKHERGEKNEKQYTYLKKEQMEFMKTLDDKTLREAAEGKDSPFADSKCKEIADWAEYILKERGREDFLTYDLMDLQEFEVITPTEDMELTGDYTVLHGSIARDGPYDYYKKGNMITLYKDYNNLKDVYSRYDYLPIKFAIDKAHYGEELGFAYNFTPNDEFNTIDADLVLLKDIKDLGAIIKEDYHVSPGYHDHIKGNIQYVKELDHIAFSGGDNETARACTGMNEKGASCTTVNIVNHDQNLNEVVKYA